MDSKMNLGDLWEVFKRFWIWVLVSAVVCGSAAYLYTSFLVTPKYTASIALIGSNGSAMVNEGAIENSELVASVNIAETYIEMLRLGDKYLIDAGKMFSPSISVDKLRKYISFSQVGDTPIIRISATTTDPQLSADICIALGVTAPEFIKSKTQGGIAKPLNENVDKGVLTSPNVNLTTALAFVFGAIVMYALAVLLTFLDNTVKREEDFKAKMPYTFLGEVPSLGIIKKAKDKTKYEKAAESSAFQFVETFKSIRVSVFYALSTAKSNVVIMSSANENEGKSTVIYNLSIAVAQSDAKVLLIDADMRRPTIHRFFKMSNKEGLSRVLSGQASFEESVVTAARPNLDILLSGPTPPNPAELLSSDAMMDFIADVSKKYDYVLIDTPPINIVADALALLDKSAGLLIVARHKTTTYPELEKAVEKVVNINGKILGVVINDVERAKKSYYKKGRYYSYYRSSSRDKDED